MALRIEEGRRRPVYSVGLPLPVILAGVAIVVSLLLPLVQILRNWLR